MEHEKWMEAERKKKTEHRENVVRRFWNF